MPDETMAKIDEVLQRVLLRRPSRKRRRKTIRIVETAYSVLSEYHPMTVRQVYYQLVARHIIENKRSQYQAVSNALRDARKFGEIPWEWIEDRLRRPRTVGMWADLAEFAVMAAEGYRRDVWATQDHLVEVWLEKDALSGLFEDVLRPYGVTLNVGRGYDGWSSIRNAAMRYRAWDNRDEVPERVDGKYSDGGVTILYFGDFDPSGRDMVRSLRERIGFFGTYPDIVISALLRSDIDEYDLPPDFAKRSDSRSASFIAEHGDVSVELDALPIQALLSRLESEVLRLMDLDALEKVRALEADDKSRITLEWRAEEDLEE
jgi:hypothetical protein